MTRVNTAQSHAAAAQAKSAQGKERAKGKAPAGAAERLARIAAKNPNADALITAGLSKKDAQSDLDQLLSDPQKLAELQKATGVDVTPANETGEAAKGGKVVDAPEKPGDVSDVKKPDDLMGNKVKKSGKWHMKALWAAAENGDMEALKTLVKILTKKIAAEDYQKNLEEIRKASKKESDNSGMIVSIVMMIVSIILTCIGLAILAMILMVIVQVAMKAAKGDLTGAGASIGGLAAGLACSAVCPALAQAVSTLVTTIIEQSVKAAKGEKIDGAAIGGAVAGCVLAAAGAYMQTDQLASTATKATETAKGAEEAATTATTAASSATTAANAGDVAGAASQLNFAERALMQAKSMVTEAREQLTKAQELLKPLQEKATQEMTKFGTISAETQHALDEATKIIDSARDAVVHAEGVVQHAEDAVKSAAFTVQSMPNSKAPNAVEQFTNLNDSVDESLKGASLARQAAEKSAEAKKTLDPAQADVLNAQADQLLQQSKEAFNKAQECLKKAQEIGNGPLKDSFEQATKYLKEAGVSYGSAAGEIKGGILGSTWGTSLKKADTFIGQNALFSQENSNIEKLANFGNSATKKALDPLFKEKSEEEPTSKQQIAEYLGTASEGASAVGTVSDGLSTAANGIRAQNAQALASVQFDPDKMRTEIDKTLNETLMNEEMKKFAEMARADILANVRESLKPYAGKLVSAADYVGLVNLSNPRGSGYFGSTANLAAQGMSGAKAVLDIDRLKQEEERRESTYSLADDKFSLELQSYTSLASAGASGVGALNFGQKLVVPTAPIASRENSVVQTSRKVLAMGQQLSQAGSILFRQASNAQRIQYQMSSSSGYYGKPAEGLYDQAMNREQVEQVNQSAALTKNAGQQAVVAIVSMGNSSNRGSNEDKEKEAEKARLNAALAQQALNTKALENQRSLNTQLARAERHKENQENAGLVPVSPGRQGSAQDFRTRREIEQRSQAYVLSSSQQLQIALAKDQRVMEELLTPAQRRERQNRVV